MRGGDIIHTSKGEIIFIDKEDYDYFSQWKWSVNSDGLVYRCTIKSKKSITVYLHREIMRARVDEEVDHINHNKLDNRKENLRLCIHQQNSFNKTKPKRVKPTSSKYKGVYSVRNKWRAIITLNNKKRHLGYFNTEEEAALAYNIKAKELFGEFACLNEVYNIT